MTQIGQTLLGKFANAYEPLLEQYIGQPVILDVADPIDPANVTVQYAGYLADHTQNYIAIFNIEHTTAEEVRLAPPGDRGGGVAAAAVPAAGPGVGGAGVAGGFEEPGRDGGAGGWAVRLQIMNRRHEAVVVRQLVREGFEPLNLGVVVPPNGNIELPARDAHGGTLFIEVIRCLDVVAPRKYATVRHAGELLERRVGGGVSSGSVAVGAKAAGNERLGMMEMRR